MMGKQSYKSWTITDEFWEAVKAYIPEHERDGNHKFQRKVGGGRKPPDKRKILEAVL
jgi:transposase